MSSQPSVVIRPAEEVDLDAIVELVWEVAAEGRFIGAEVPFDREARRRRYADSLSDPLSAILVADASADGGPSVVGEISVGVTAYGVGEIGMLLAAPYRGQGLGGRLLEAAIQFARRAGAHKMWLEVWPHNTAALALYRRAGFVEEGRKRRHYRRRNDERWDSLLMGLDLEPAAGEKPAAGG